MERGRQDQLQPFPAEAAVGGADDGLRGDRDGDTRARAGIAGGDAERVPGGWAQRCDGFSEVVWAAQAGERVRV